MRRLVVCAVISVASHDAGAQRCAVPPQPLFDFQVERPATYIVDTAVHPRPLAEHSMPAQPWAVVHFVVDASGRVDSTTVGFILTRSNGGQDSIRSVVHLWRFRPASIGQCKVPQLVQAVIAP